VLVRVLHAALLSTQEHGVIQQMSAEASAARSLGLTWHPKIYAPSWVNGNSDVIVTASVDPRFREARKWEILNHWLSWRRQFYGWLTEVAEDYDAVLVRHTPHDPFRSSAFASMGRPVVSVHHTLEVSELRLQGARGYLKGAFERRWGSRSLSQTAAIVGVTDEILQYELTRMASPRPGLVWPNGIDLEAHPVADDARGTTPEIVFVANAFAPWHGLDRLLQSTARSPEKFVLHLVGKLPDEHEAAVAGDPRIRRHGVVSSSHLHDLMAAAWVGLSSFGLDRQGMRQACTLKVRSYLAAGLPVYAGHGDVFPTDLAAYRCGPPSVEAILGFAQEMRSLARTAIRQDASAHIDKRELLRVFYAALNDLPLSTIPSDTERKDH
jgi:hypothetical protein